MGLMVVPIACGESDDDESSATDPTVTGDAASGEVSSDASSDDSTEGEATGDGDGDVTGDGDTSGDGDTTGDGDGESNCDNIVGNGTTVGSVMNNVQGTDWEGNAFSLHDFCESTVLLDLSGGFW